MFSININHPVGDSEWQDKFELESAFPEIIKNSKNQELCCWMCNMHP